MTKSYLVKLTVEVPTEDYFALTKKKHHGQLSQIVRKFVKSLVQMEAEGNSSLITDWVYGKEPLTLCQPKEE